VLRTDFFHPYLRPLASRLALWLSFLAVLSALSAPAAALSMDMRSGKLGGVCNLDSSKGLAFNAASSPAQGDAQETSNQGHCTWCGSLGLALLPAPSAAN
jgi:carbohydrate-selective porin OprB